MSAEFLIGLVYSFGYIGVFASSLIGSASIVLPVPIFFLIFTSGALLDPLLVGIIAGIGSAAGELVAYAIGFGGRKLIDKRKKKIKIKKNMQEWFRLGERWMHKHGGFIVILIFSATPLPDDIIGIICGSIKYDIKKYFVACVLGKTALSVFLAYAGFYGINWVLGCMGS